MVHTKKLDTHVPEYALNITSRFVITVSDLHICPLVRAPEVPEEFFFAHKKIILWQQVITFCARKKK